MLQLILVGPVVHWFQEILETRLTLAILQVQWDRVDQLVQLAQVTPASLEILLVQLAPWVPYFHSDQDYLVGLMDQLVQQVQVHPVNQDCLVRQRAQVVQCHLFVPLQQMMLC